MDIGYSHSRAYGGYRFTNRELPMPSGGFNHQISCTCYWHVLISCGGKQLCPPLGICKQISSRWELASVLNGTAPPWVLACMPHSSIEGSLNLSLQHYLGNRAWWFCYFRKKYLHMLDQLRVKVKITDSYSTISFKLLRWVLELTSN